MTGVPPRRRCAHRPHRGGGKLTSAAIARHSVRYDDWAGKEDLCDESRDPHGPSRGRAPTCCGYAPPFRMPLVSGMWSCAAIVSGCSWSDSQVTQPNIVGDDQHDARLLPRRRDHDLRGADPRSRCRCAPDATESQSARSRRAAFLAAFGATRCRGSTPTTYRRRFVSPITNLDDASNTVELLVDPWNPYVKYKPGVEIVSDEETLPDFSGYDRYYVLGQKERLVGTLVPDDTRELANDLATVMNISVIDPTDPDGNGLFNHTFNLQNRSTRPTDLLIEPYIPQRARHPSDDRLRSRLALARADERRGRGDGRRPRHHRQESDADDGPDKDNAPLPLPAGRSRPQRSSRR